MLRSLRRTFDLDLQIEISERRSPMADRPADIVSPTADGVLPPQPATAQATADPPPTVPDNHVLILFGATGDLAKRKLLPGLFHLSAAGLMPERYRIIGSGRPRQARDTSHFRTHAREAVDEFGRRETTDENWAAFAETLSFAAASAEDPDRLVEAVARAERELGGDVRRLIYLAVPPDAMPPMVSMLGASGLSERARVIVEKPFGHDLRSACALNQTLHAVLEESQIFRIDHFLGKEQVQNILAFRFANGLFEPVWNRRHIDYVQIDVPERLTIEGRAGFFEQTGTFRDMIVTHLLHVLGFIAMEPPERLDAQSLQGASDKVFAALKPLDPARAVFGQYANYRSEPGVAQDSTVETFVAVEALIDNDRWAGVPFLLRTGKALAEDRTTVTLGFKEPARRMFELAGGRSPGARPNEISLELSEPGVIWVDFLAKEPGARMSLGSASLAFRYGDSFNVRNELKAYERLLHDAMLGDPTLFTSAEGIERLWEISAPLLERPRSPTTYASGSWGPAAIDELVAPHRWHLPYPS
jgi:glucose-6-phosphate 1-dehydrogenase